VTSRTPRRKSKGTGQKGPLLEQCVGQLRLVGFMSYPDMNTFQKAQVVPERYVIRNYPHDSLYGTRGRKEALLVAANSGNGFVPDGDGKMRVVIEAKWQETGGSTDEKLPYIWHAFLASPIHNWIVILDGRYWKEGRGKAARSWLSGMGAGPEGRRLYVVDQKEFTELAHHEWGSAS